MKPPINLSQKTSRYLYVCINCRSYTLASSLTIKPTRRYSTTAPPPTAAYTLLSSRRLISLTGPDSTHYLQGVITANISPSSPRATGFYAAFLNAPGRLLNDVFIYPHSEDGTEGWLIEVDAKEVQVLANHIKRYRLRSKFEVRIVEEGERSVWSVWREGEGEGEGGRTPHGPATSRPDSGLDGWIAKGGVACEDKRAPGMGRRLLLPGGQKPPVDCEESTQDAYRLRRYLKGVPEGQDELPREHALPQESNIDFMGGIDYKKGCYVGQELTIRTHHRGVVRKRILPVMLYGKDEEAPAALEYMPRKELGVEGIPRETGIGRINKRGRSAGKFIMGMGNVGLGLCRLETMTGVQVQGEAGAYQEGDEFKLEWEVEGKGQIVKIKAFVPPWHPKQYSSL
ncbi:hypothetical protein PZA11_006145 [Diplocarpon coronariae]|uniref:Iron-sulfur cluster assembly factor IBA57 homolog, mitochondrial n=1 Tax=Diplocarpon coronariae TaxID=2795749 RepID=A0A218Z4R3_9HELO|nr:folate-binding protein YgfZ [Diplocarpon mali]OWP02255.1 hypothetical protein B2J93_1043 [Marssonina coronariae]